MFYLKFLVPSRFAEEVKHCKQKMAKWKTKVEDRLQVLEKRARGKTINTVPIHLVNFGLYSDFRPVEFTNTGSCDMVNQLGKKF